MAALAALLNYSRLPDGTLFELDEAKERLGDWDLIIVVIIFAVILILLMLIYFALFLYQRIRFPKSDPECELGILGLDTQQIRADSLNRVLTKDELLGRGSTDATTGPTVHKSDQERSGAKMRSASRVMPTDAQSDASEETSESVMARHDFQTKEEVNEVEDGPEKLSMPLSDRGKARISAEFQRAGMEDPPSTKQFIEEKKRIQYVAEFAEAYRLSVRREGQVTGQQRVLPQSRISKFSWR